MQLTNLDASRACLACLSRGPHQVVSVPGDPGDERSWFDYIACSNCATLQIAQIPEDFARFYASDYYSFAEYFPPAGVKGWLKQYRDRATVLAAGPLADASRMLWGENLELQKLKSLFDGSMPTPFTRHSSILDVGCGNGHLLKELHHAGFTNLLGIDPFLTPSGTGQGPKLQKAELTEISGAFDIVMMNHSLEHVADPEAMLKALHEHSAPHGVALIRVPITPSWAWSEYGCEWVQLDAPRHLTIFSEQGLTQMAERVGWRLITIEQDSTGWQIAGSLLRQRGIDWHRDPKAVERTFSPAERTAFAKTAQELNAAGQGDQAAFFFAAA